MDTDTYNGTSDTMQIGQILDTGVFCFIWADLGTNYSESSQIPDSRIVKDGSHIFIFSSF